MKDLESVAAGVEVAVSFVPMVWLYRLLFLPVMLVLAPGYLLRMRRRGGYGEKFVQRFGAGHRLPPRRPGVQRVWVQAVSVGEMLAIGPLLQSLTSEGDVEIYLTTTTSTGFKLARERYAGLTVGIGYFPLDWWFFSARTWRAIAPDLAILTEGERWPEHIHQANTRRVPVLSVNARLSDRSFRRMRRFRWALQGVLRGLDHVLAGSAHDADRFLELGVRRDALEVTGNLKLDVAIPRLAEAEGETLRRELGLPTGLVLLGSSTWPGEEEVLLAAYRKARAEGLACGLLLVPRHAERRREVERLLSESGVTSHFRSRGAAPAVVDVAVGDTTGELQKLAQLADVVFVGKSLPPNEGGQTPVEAAALGKPIVFGPRMTNFTPIARELTDGGAALQAADAAQAENEIALLLRSPERRQAMAEAAVRWHTANAGAVQRTVAAIRQRLPQR